MRLSFPTLLLREFLSTCGPALMLLLFGSTLSAQPEYRYKADTLRNQVIAVSGLNFRDAPGSHGRILTKIPFMERVKILNDTAFALQGEDSPYVEDFNFWVKASYAGQTGYLFDAYLYYPVGKPSPQAANDFPEGINEKYRLFTNRGSAALNYEHFDYEWFGLYPGKSDCTLRAESPSYRYYPGEIEERLSMTSNQKAAPRFFLASQKSWKTGPRSGTVITWDGRTAEDTAAASGKLSYTYKISRKPGTPGSWASAQELTLTIGNQSQHLNPGGRAGSAVYVEAATDLDGDGKTDFIISYDAKGYDSTFIFALFLSSEARTGELVRPVAMQYVYDGC